MSDELLARKGAPQPRERTWRIPCFVVDRRFRRHGVAGVALHAAMRACRNGDQAAGAQLAGNARIVAERFSSGGWRDLLTSMAAR